MENPKPPAHLHTIQILVATLAGIVSIIGGVYSIRANLFQGNTSYGQLTGSVRDERLAKPLRLATVEVSDTNGNLISTLSTDDNGTYSLKNLMEGNYEVRVSAPLHIREEKKLSIQRNRTTTVDFNLAPTETSEPPSRREPVSVTARPVQAFPLAPSNLPLASNPEDSEPPYETSYRDSYPRRYRSYPYQDQERLTQRQPTGSELLVKAGALLVEQMLEKKKKTAETTNSSENPKSL